MEQNKILDALSLTGLRGLLLYIETLGVLINFFGETVIKLNGQTKLSKQNVFKL